MNMNLCFLFLVYLFVGTFCYPTDYERAKRQQPVDQISTTTPGTTTTTASPRYRACINACQTTQEYNPVCGSDGVTYNNAARLRCAIRCGNNIQQAFSATCQPVS